MVAASIGWPAGWAAALDQLEVGSGAAVPVVAAACEPAGDRRARAELVDLLERHRWRRASAARELGISRVTLWRRMRRAGLAEPDGATPDGAGDE